MRADLSSYAPDVIASQKLMCCAFGRFLPQEDFSLEHILPQQVLVEDLPEVRSLTTRNARSRLTLLCSKPIKLKEWIYDGGCNGWKGRFYDGPLRQALNRAIVAPRLRATMQHSVAVFCTAYLAMVHHFGYQIALTQAGLRARRQFFSPRSFLAGVPPQCQMLMLGSMPAHVSKNQLEMETLSTLIQSVYRSLSTAGNMEVAPAPVQTPAVPIKKSVFPDHIICLEDGKKLKMLKRHLQASYGLTPDAYRAKWGLPWDYPMVAPSYAATRSSLAKKIGLGRKPTAAAELAKPKVAKLPARRARGSRG